MTQHKEINAEVGKANAVTNEMTRRAMCIKCMMWLAVLALFALLVVSIIYRLNKSKSDK